MTAHSERAYALSGRDYITTLQNLGPFGHSNHYSTTTSGAGKGAGEECWTVAVDMVSHLKPFKFLLEMGIPKHLVALVQTLYVQQTAKVRFDGKSSEAFTIGKGTRQGCNISPVEFNLYAEDMKSTLENNEHGNKVGGRQINNLRYADDKTLLTTT